MSKKHSKIKNGIRVLGTASDPSDPEEGDLIFRSDTSPKEFKVYKDGAWRKITTGSNRSLQYDAIVGSSSEVNEGLATHTSITAAIAAVSNYSSILVLYGSYSESVTIDKILHIQCERNSSISGNLTLDCSGTKISGLAFYGLSFSSTSSNNTVEDCRIYSYSVGTPYNIVDSGIGNTYSLNS